MSSFGKMFELIEYADEKTVRKKNTLLKKDETGLANVKTVVFSEV